MSTSSKIGVILAQVGTPEEPTKQSHHFAEIWTKKGRHCLLFQSPSARRSKTTR